MARRVQPDELASRPEFAIADAALVLATEENGQREPRPAGSETARFRSGAHAYRIGVDGFEVFPRLSDVDDTRYELGRQRASSGIPALDQMLGDGYWPGSATLVIGPSGCGKTVMGLQFIFGGARAGEPGVFASLQENRVQVERNDPRIWMESRQTGCRGAVRLASSPPRPGFGTHHPVP